MKKLYSSLVWRERTKRLQAYRRKRDRASWPASARRNARDRIVVAPENFSMIENPQYVLRFIDQVMRYAREGGRIRLDFRDIENLTPDAAALLVAKARERRLQETARVRASKPTRPGPRRIWNDSGLTDAFQSADADVLPEPRGKIIMKSQVKVDADAALFLRDFAKAHLELEDDAHWLSIQTILLESMANTVNHSEGAGRNQTHASSEPWYAAVYCDE